MKNANHILFLTVLVVIFSASCTKMAPVKESLEFGTKSSSNSVVVESTTISIGNDGEGGGNGNITDPDHDTDHDRDKAKPKVQ